MAKVGVAWSGNPTFKNDSIRSIKLDVFAGVLQHEKCKFFSLQKEVRQTDIEALHSLCTLNNIAQDFTDFCDTAAAIINLDLVITVDTAVAHLAGALGKPVWIMLPFDSDYRWLRGCNDSIWYPSARLFRQPRAGDWASVFEEIKIALDDFSERKVFQPKRSLSPTLFPS